MRRIDDKLTEFGKKIVAVIAKYRLVTQPLLRIRFGKTESEVKNEIRRLTHRGIVASFPFVRGQVYYRLTHRTCIERGLSKRLSGVMGAQSLRMNFGLLDFLFAGNPPRRLLTESELDFLFFGDDLPNPKPSFLRPTDRLYLNTDDQRVLSHVWIDCRSDARRLISKGHKFMQDRSEHRAFRQMLIDDQFRFTYVTETQGKKDQILEVAERKELSKPIVYVSQELTNL